MNKNKKEYLKPSVAVVLLMSQGNLLTGTGTMNTYNAENSSGTEASKDEEIISYDEIL